jgi:hypothetical protein
MLRIQRLRQDIGNGGNGTCEISYMQGRKYPNASETVEPVQGVSNKNLLKNPYNTLNEPIAKAGQRPLMITTDNRGNVFSRSEVKMVKGVTNDTLLKNPYNILEMPVGEKKVLSHQRIKDINNRLLPDYITENRGINEVMLQILTMIIDKPVKLITIHLLKILITKNAKEHGYQSQQKILSALNAFDQVMTQGRRVFKENSLSPTRIPDMLRQYVDVYEAEIKRIYGNMSGTFKNIDTDIQTGLTELGLLSNGLTRMFSANNAVDPSNTLTQEQIQAAASAAPNSPPPVIAPPPASGVPQQAGPEEKELEEKGDIPTTIITPKVDPFDAPTMDKYITANIAKIRVFQRSKGSEKMPIIKQILDQLVLISKTPEDGKANLVEELRKFMVTHRNVIGTEIREFNDLPSFADILTYLGMIGNFFFQPKPQQVVQSPPVQSGNGRRQQYSQY